MLFPQMQTEMNMQQSQSYDLARLTAFVTTQYPIIAQQLEANITSTAFDGYEVNSSSNHGAFHQFSTILDEEYLESIRISQGPSRTTTSTTPSTSSSGRLSSYSAAAVSWSCNGAYVACAYGALDHPGWCNHKAKVQIWNILRTRRVPLILPDQVTVPIADFAQEASIPLPCCATDVLFHPTVPSLLAVALTSGEVRVIDLSPQKGCPINGYSETSKAETKSDDAYEDDFDGYDDDFDDEATTAPPAPSPPISASTDGPVGILSMSAPVGDYWHRDTVRKLAWVRSHTTGASQNPYQQYLLISAGLDGKLLAWKLDSQLTHYADTALVLRGAQYHGHGTRAIDVDQLRELEWLGEEDGLGTGFSTARLLTLGKGMGLDGDARDDADFEFGSGIGVGVGVDVPSVSITALACPSIGPSTLDTTSTGPPLPGAPLAADGTMPSEDAAALAVHPYRVLVGTEGGGVIACVLRGLLAPQVGMRRLGGHNYSSEAAQIVSLAPLRNQHDIQKLVDESRFPSSRTITPTDLFKILRSGPHTVRNQPVWSLLSPSPITTVYNSHSAPVTGLAFSPFNSRLFASCSLDGFFRIYHADSPSPVLDLQPTLKSDRFTGAETRETAVSLQALAWSPAKPTVLVVADNKANIFVYNLSEDMYAPVLIESVQSIFRSASEQISSLQFCANDPTLLTIASQSGGIHLIQLGSQFSEFSAEDTFVLSSLE